MIVKNEKAESLSKNFRPGLVRMVRAAGETISNFAEEIVGRKPGTTEFEIVIKFPLNRDMDPVPVPVPVVEVRQSYVSDEAYAAYIDWITEGVRAASNQDGDDQFVRATP